MSGRNQSQRVAAVVALVMVAAELGVLAAQSGTGAAAPGIIAFTAQVDKNWELFVSHPDGTGVRRLTHTPYDEREPAISPDGRVIAVSTSGGGIELVSVAAGDGPEVLALPKGWFRHPAWSSDGSRLYFVRLETSRAWSGHRCGLAT